MKKNIILLSLLLVCLAQPLQLLAQGNQAKNVKAELNAQIVDANGNPIAGVLVSGNEGADQTRSNALGEFVISVTDKSNLVFEADGYEKATMNRARIVTNFMKVMMQPAKDIRVDGLVNLPFQQMTKSRTSGNIAVIDAKKALDRDVRMDIGSQLNSKLTGNFGSFNFHGLGDAVTIVDGVIRDASDINMQEVEQITVLKDAYSRMLYGGDGDKPVVLITTKSGEKFKKVLNFNLETGVASAISKPKFLDAARYMETYNKAAVNDGLAPKFDSTTIASTRNNVDPVLYPNNNYWGGDFVKNTTNYTNLYAEASGGNDKVQYFMNLGWKRNSGWLAMPQDDETNKLNLRGKVDFEVASWLKMKADIVAVFDFYKGPRTTTFFNDASKMLPHLYPLLVPTNRVLNDSALAGKFPIGNSLLGGTKDYKQNLQGDMSRNGSRMDLNRFLQYMLGFDVSLEKLTKGLKLSGNVDIDFFNYYSQFIENSYAVYEIDKTTINADKKFNLTKINQDVFTSKQSLNDDKSSFRRVYNAYVTANYDRTFGKHQVSAVALAFYNQNIISGVIQDAKRLRFGGQANYTYADKYSVELGLLSEGSNKMDPSKRFKTSPSFGASWVMSNENFLKDNAVIDYLKVRANYGVIVNDNFNVGNYAGYFLYEPNFAKIGTYTYNNSFSSNSTITIQSLGNLYDFQERKEFVTGFDAYLLDKKLFVESSYWNSLSAGNLVTLTNNTPATLGLNPVGNFNETRYQGVELGLNYTDKVGDFKFNLGVNYLYSVSNIEKYEEPVYPEQNKHLSRVGTSATALWGLTSLGLYNAADFEADGTTLVDDIAQPSYGVVRIGDIKYKDINDDDIINSDDQSVLGLFSNNQQVTLNLDFDYKNWQLLVVGSASWGGSGMKNSNYYNFKGVDAKYSEEALKSYDPLNPDASAAYPRLSLSNGNNNYNNSTFWMYDRASFWLNNVQLAYNFQLAPSAALKTLKLYARGGNLFTGAKNVDIMQLNWNSAPQSRVFTFGLVANF